MKKTGYVVITLYMLIVMGLYVDMAAPWSVSPLWGTLSLFGVQRTDDAIPIVAAILTTLAVGGVVLLAHALYRDVCRWITSKVNTTSN